MATQQEVKTKAGLSMSQSVALIRNLVRAGISEVCYLRSLFVRLTTRVS